MRAVFAALILTTTMIPAAARAADGQDDADEAPAGPRADAVLKVGFPRGNPFGKHKLPELQIVDSETRAVVASVRAREWTPISATYAAALPTGRVYGLRWAIAASEPPFAELPIADGAQGTLTFRIPYVPRLRRPAGDPVATSVAPARR